VEWFKENPSVFGEALLILDDNNYELCIDMVIDFKNLGWNHIHQCFCPTEESDHHWGVYQKIYECSECDSEFVKLSESLNCCLAKL
jgi:hypothetical protein